MDRTGKVKDAADTLWWLTVSLPTAASILFKYVDGWAAAFVVSLAGYPAIWVLSRRFMKPPTADERPAPSPQPLSPPPAFHQYTEDTFEGIRWRWKWDPGSSDPSPSSVVELAGYCEKCGLGLHAAPEDWLETFGGRLVEARRASSYPDPVFPRSGCRYYCQVCQKRWTGALFDGPCKDGPMQIKRMIERAAREKIGQSA